MDFQNTSITKSTPAETAPNVEQLPMYLQTKLNNLLQDWNIAKTWDVYEWEQFWEDSNPIERCWIGKKLFPTVSMQEHLSNDEKSITEINAVAFAKTLVGLLSADAYDEYSGILKNGKYINAAFWREMQENINHFIHFYKKRLREEPSDRRSIEAWLGVLENCKEVIA